MSGLKNCGMFTQWDITQQKKEGIPTFCDSMVATGDDYAKWSKLVGERQIPYDLTYKRKLMNKIEPEASIHGIDWQV